MQTGVYRSSLSFFGRWRRSARMKKVLTVILLVTFVCNTIIPPALLSAKELPAPTAGDSLQSLPLLGRAGQSVTLLPDGRWLLLGGEGENGPDAQARMWDPQSGELTFLGTLVHARTGHSATVLPDGTVLIFGGIGRDEQLVEDAEVFMPETKTFTSLATPGLTPRAYHTATLLTDGRVLLAGGVSSRGETLNTAELWDFHTPHSALRTRW